MKLYNNNGYLNIDEIINSGYPFIFVVGGRGTGKTYGALKYAVESKRKFMLMRRTQAQADMILSNAEFSPFKSLNRDFGWNIQVEKQTQYTSAYFDGNEQEKTFIGYTCALSTVKNLRGFDASDVDLILYDEFIPEAHEKSLAHESDALMNAYETINRNRELNGHKPVQLVCLANSNDIANPVFMGLGVVSVVETMIRKGKDVYTNKNRGLMIVVLHESPISKQKKKTALYSLTENSDFAKMATDNDFLLDESSVSRFPLNECKPEVTVGELTIYKHKSNGKFYCTTHRSGNPITFKNTDADKQRFKRMYRALWYSYLSDDIVFQSVFTEKLFVAYIK